MHFWIDKRSQTCGYNCRPRVPGSLSAGRRRSKPMVTPVHRFQSIETTGHVRRSHPQVSHTRTTANYASFTPPVSNGTANGSLILPPRQQQGTELENAPYIETAETGPERTRFKFEVGKMKFGICAIFAVATIVIIRFHSDHQGMIIVMSLGLLSLSIFITCILSLFLTKTVNWAPPPETAPPLQGPEMEIPVILPHRDDMLLVVSSSPQRTTNETVIEEEAPPPPYQIAILLPPKPLPEDLPPPPYEKAVR